MTEQPSELETRSSELPETITLDRDGQAPLRFHGKLLTTASGQFVHPPKDKPNPDYFTIGIYQVHGVHGPGPTYVVEIVYRKDLRGNTTEHHFAMTTDDPAATLGEYDPLAVLMGFPPGAEFAERQRAFEIKMRRQYDVLVSAVLKMFPDEIGDVDDGYRRGADIARYRALIEIGRNELDFTQAEASLICDALNETILDNQSWQFIDVEIEDACRLNKAHEKWNVDPQRLLDKIRDFPAVARVAIVDGVERFWRNPNQDTNAALINAGLIRKD